MEFEDEEDKISYFQAEVLNALNNATRHFGYALKWADLYYEPYLEDESRACWYQIKDQIMALEANKNRLHKLLESMLGKHLSQQKLISDYSKMLSSSFLKKIGASCDTEETI